MMFGTPSKNTAASHVVSLLLEMGCGFLGGADSGLDVWTKFPCNTRLGRDART